MSADDWPAWEIAGVAKIVYEGTTGEIWPPVLTLERQHFERIAVEVLDQFGDGARDRPQIKAASGIWPASDYEDP